MTVAIWPQAPAGETEAARILKASLIASEPELSHPEITLDIISDIYLPERQIDLVVLYQDHRSPDKFLKTRAGHPVHSFVLVIEVKNSSPDNVRFQGASLSVRYDGHWKNATYQCDQQTYAFNNFQKASLNGDQKLRRVYTQRAIWLTQVPRASLPTLPNRSSVPVHFQDMSWLDLVSELELNKNEESPIVRGFFDSPRYHNLDTLKSKLVQEIVPTKIDLDRVNLLTEKKRFTDQKYVALLGKQLLVFSGRGGTGKTVTLLKLAIYFARQNKKCVLITYNHGLISDISKLLYLAAQEDQSLKTLPKVQTRYSFIQDTFIREFGRAAEDRMRKDIPLDFREDARLQELLGTEHLETEFDFALIDEGQDWQPEQRDLIYKMFGANRVVVADGVDQFVGQDRCSWDTEEVSQKQTVTLTSSLRTKASTCQIVGQIASELGIEGWDLKPDPDVYGGRLTVLVEPHAKSAVHRCLGLLDEDVARNQFVRHSDNLVCMPSSKMSGGTNYAWLFDQAINVQNRDSWRGFDEDDRRQYARKQDQIKAVLYNSCRGMEGWATVCLGLDAFFDFQIRNPRIDLEEIENELRERDGLFADDNTEAEIEKRTFDFAVNWLMIPLTRSIDHLVIHISDENSRLAKILKEVRHRNSGAIEWLHGDSACA